MRIIKLYLFLTLLMFTACSNHPNYGKAENISIVKKDSVKTKLPSKPKLIDAFLIPVQRDLVTSGSVKNLSITKGFRGVQLFARIDSFDLTGVTKDFKYSDWDIVIYSITFNNDIRIGFENMSNAKIFTENQLIKNIQLNFDVDEIEASKFKGIALDEAFIKVYGNPEGTLYIDGGGAFDNVLYPGEKVWTIDGILLIVEEKYYTSNEIVTDFNGNSSYKKYHSGTTINFSESDWTGKFKKIHDDFIKMERIQKNMNDFQKSKNQL